MKEKKKKKKKKLLMSSMQTTFLKLAAFILLILSQIYSDGQGEFLRARKEMQSMVSANNIQSLRY